MCPEGYVFATPRGAGLRCARWPRRPGRCSQRIGGGAGHDRHDSPADVPRPPDRTGDDASRAGHRGGGRGLPEHWYPPDGHAERGHPSVRHPERWAALAGDLAASGGYGRVRARHGIPSLRARAPTGDPGGIPRGLGAARRAERARDERRARGSTDHRAILRALRPGRAVWAPRRPGVRDLHGSPDARRRRPRRGAVGKGERVGPDRRPALQPVGRNARSRRARRCIALPVRADL